MTTTAEHLRNALDGRWRDVKNRMREELSSEIFRPHYTPQHRHRAHEGGGAAQDHGGQGRRRGRLQEGARR